MLKKISEKLVHMLCPTRSMKKANKILKDKNKYDNYTLPETIENMNIKCLIEEYNHTVDTKNRFEDKAKTIIAALTIAVTLILNLSKVIEAIFTKYDISFIKWIIFFVAFFSIIYMLYAGILCIKVLIGENILYCISLENKDNKQEVYKAKKLNDNQNLIRNNIIYSSYYLIRNSAICLIIIFFLSILPISVKDSSDSQFSFTDNGRISFSVDVAKWLTTNTDVSIEEIIELCDKNIKTGTQKNIYDKKHHIMISIQKINDTYVIDSIVDNIEETN